MLNIARKNIQFISLQYSKCTCQCYCVTVNTSINCITFQFIYFDDDTINEYMQD